MKPASRATLWAPPRRADSDLSEELFTVSPLVASEPPEPAEASAASAYTTSRAPMHQARSGLPSVTAAHASFSADRHLCRLVPRSHRDEEQRSHVECPLLHYPCSRLRRCRCRSSSRSTRVPPRTGAHPDLFFNAATRDAAGRAAVLLNSYRTVCEPAHR